MSEAGDQILVIIVTYNSASDIHACLESLRAGRLQGSARVTVVDNASADGTAEIVAREFPEVQLRRNERNVYYARACNQGAETVGRDVKYLVLLNPDVRLGEDTLSRLADYLKNNEDVAAVAPRLLWPTGGTQQSVRRFPTFATLWAELLGLSRLFPHRAGAARWKLNLDDVTQPIDVDQPMASCLMVRRSMWDKLGGFDERFPMFFNDVDLCFRVKKLGGRIVYLPEAIAVHRLGGSTRPVMARMVWFSHLGFLRYLRKHHRKPWDIFLYLLTTPAVMAAALVRSAYWMCRGRVSKRRQSEPTRQPPAKGRG